MFKKALVESVLLHVCLGILLLSTYRTPRPTGPTEVQFLVDPSPQGMPSAEKKGHSFKNTLKAMPSQIPAETGAQTPVVSQEGGASVDQNLARGGGQLDQFVSNYAVEVRNQIDSHIEYPFSLRRRGIQGQVFLKLVLSQNGNLESSTIVRSSGFSELDRLALNAVQGAAPFPKFNPIEIGSTQVSFNLPIHFKVTQ